MRTNDRHPRHRIRFCLVIGSSVFSSCTWTRFDDVTDNPPVERFETPNSISSLGLSVAAYSTTGGGKLVAAGSNQIVLYDLGAGSNPTRTAASTQSCAGDNGCVLARNLAALRSDALTGNLGCVAYGMGTVTESSGSASGKLWLYCEDATRRSLDLPLGMQNWLATNSLTSESKLLLATPRHMGTPALAAASPDASLAWFYTGSNAAPIELPALPDGKKVARAIAVIPNDTTGSTYMIAASSQTTNEVFVFDVDATRTATVAGCLTGPDQFGRLLGTGDFGIVSRAALLVADATTIYAIDGSSLVQALANGASPCTDVSSTTFVKATCATDANVDGCSARPFPASMTAASLDLGEELIVGVPEATVRGESAAGAVFIYSLAGGTFEAVESLFVSSATSGDRLGTSVAAAPGSGLDRIVAGAPGDNSVMEFFCNSLVPASAKSSRCP